MTHNLKEQIAKLCMDGVCSGDSSWDEISNEIANEIVVYFEDHYWDSLQINKDIIMVHVRAMLLDK